MTRKIYWGVALLIVGFVAFQIYLYVDMENFNKDFPNDDKTTETEKPTELPVVIDDPKLEGDPIQPIKPNEVDIPKVPEDNSQQNGSVETVAVENYLEGITEINLFDSITTPTDTELANYTRAEVVERIHELHKAILKSAELNNKYTEQNEALRETQHAILKDVESSKKNSATLIQLVKQSKELDRIGIYLHQQEKQLFQESKRTNEEYKKRLR